MAAGKRSPRKHNGGATKGLRQPSIHELKERLRVSAMTISRVVNNQPGVSQATRKRILDY